MINETANVFKLGISQEVPEEMRAYLEKDAFIFSGLKTHAQLAEARSLLKDENGNIKPYHLFEQDILKLNDKYNLNYLDAEYQFAQASSQSAANWANLSDSDRYNLQYRTAGDERVRESHAAINGTTLPKSSSFWVSYYPPNGWRCRCIAVLVLASKYPATDVEKATAAAERATTQIGKNGKNKLEMFRFNPGIEKKMFPPNNSYTKVAGADRAQNALKEDFVPDNLKKYLKEKGVEIDPEFFGLLKEKISFEVTKSHDDYNDHFKRVRIRDYGTEYNVKAIIYHEFGHALDYQHGDLFKKTAKLMNKYMKRGDYDEYFKKLDLLAINEPVNSVRDKYEKGRLRDTIMSLNLNYGFGHTKKYFTQKGEFNRNREFLAHAFENKFVGNNMFKKLAPELYDDMNNMMDEILKEIK
ncbi:phage minor head protein [Chryseobacterium cucumeris]|uniref:phage minor head protein n=1 Tax=Chryseobacterium cucumeris TaxID=1813611 RepID=UPI0037C058FD